MPAEPRARAVEPLAALAAAGIRLRDVTAAQRAVVASLSPDEVTTVMQLKRRPDEVAREDEIDARSWWGGSIF